MPPFPPSPLLRTSRARSALSVALGNSFRGERTVDDSGQRPERAPRFERQQRSFTPDAAAAQAQPRPDRGGWRGNRGDDGQRGWRGNAPATPPAVVAQPQPAPRARDRGMAGALGFDRDRDQRRDWNRNNGAERNWNRNREAQRNWRQNNDAQRNWNRDNANRDWNRDNASRDWNRNDVRRTWNGNDGRRFDNDRRWNGNRNAGNWNRSWRNDRRYDWQGYRNSNRYAYRLSQYYAPRGWNYGYRRFDIGTTLFAGLFAQNYWIGNPYEYRLPPVEWPFQWVRYYDDALLVDTETGEVVDVISGIFW